MAWILSSGLLLLAVSGQFPTPSDWKRADAATVRLPPSAFPELPQAVRAELERRGCAIPLAFGNRESQSVIRGRFTSASRVDIAVPCSRKRISSILVFRNGSVAAVADIAKRPDADFLQVVGPDTIGFSRALGAADPAYIWEHYKRYDGPEPPRLDHDGINDAFVEKGSVVWYWHGGRWLQLTGAD